MLVYQRVAGHHCDICFRVVPVEVCDGVTKEMMRNDTVDVVSDFSLGRLFPRYMHLGFWRCFFLFLVAKGVCYIFGFDLIHLLSSSNIAVDPIKRGETSVSGRERSRLRMSIFVDQEFQEHERSATCVAQCFRTVRQQQVAFETFLQIISSSSFFFELWIFRFKWQVNPTPTYCAKSVVSLILAVPCEDQSKDYRKSSLSIRSWAISPSAISTRSWCIFLVFVLVDTYFFCLGMRGCV